MASSGGNRRSSPRRDVDVRSQPSLHSLPRRSWSTSTKRRPYRAANGQRCEDDCLARRSEPAQGGNRFPGKRHRGDLKGAQRPTLREIISEDSLLHLGGTCSPNNPGRSSRADLQFPSSDPSEISTVMCSNTDERTALRKRSANENERFPRSRWCQARHGPTRWWAGP
jgi:hypothetical protein